MKTSNVSMKALVVALAIAMTTLALAGCSANRTSAEALSSGSAGGNGQASLSSVPHSSSTGSAASSGTSASSASRQSGSPLSGPTITGMATAVSEIQVAGNDEVGYVKVPSDWEDRTDDIAIGTADAYKIVYYANPSTRYASDTLGHDSFGEALQLMAAPASSEAMAADIVADFKRNTDSFSLVESRDILVDERPAVLIVATMPKDGLRVATVVIDRDGDGRVAVAITMNCGEDDLSFGEAIERATAWSRQTPPTQGGSAAAEEPGAQAAGEEGLEDSSQQ